VTASTYICLRILTCTWETIISLHNNTFALSIYKLVLGHLIKWHATKLLSTELGIGSPFKPKRGLI